MRMGPPALFPLFRSELQARILARVVLGGGEESVVELASAIAADPGNTAREVARLERAGILTSRRVGRTKLIQVHKAAPFYQSLRDLITVVLGPAVVLAEHLADVERIVFADVFGSWAARFRGEHGPDPADIDLLVVGDPDRDDLYDATQKASRRLNRPVNPVVVSERRWREAEEGFIVELRSRPRATVIARREGDQ